MAKILKGAAVAEAIDEKTKLLARELSENGVTPTLAIVRLGERDDDIYYERAAAKRCEKTGVAVENVILDSDLISQNGLLNEIKRLNDDEKVHGVLILRPLPRHLDENAVLNALSPEKDVDGATNASLAEVFTSGSGGKSGFAPCTAQACIEILDFYEADVSGKRAVVAGRSLTVGKPVAMMLLGKNATVTLCHTKTENLQDEVKRAEIVILCAGRAEMASDGWFSAGQTVIDVGINVTADGRLCGDADFDSACRLVGENGAVTPVPGGVGAVTTSVLSRNVALAAAKRLEVLNIKYRKARLRAEIRSQAKLLEQEYLNKSDAAIYDALLEMPAWKQAKNIFIYISVSTEPDTRKLIDAAFESEKTVAVPRCLKNGVMEARIITSLDGLREKAFGIPEPDESFPLMPQAEIDLVVVPCVTADSGGNRLGNGAGYYDRYLKDINCETVCLCRGRLLAREVPAENADTAVKTVLTENEILRN